MLNRRKILSKIVIVISGIILTIFKVFKLQENKYLFESFIGKNYAGNPKEIYETLYQEKKGKYIWSINNKKTFIPGNAKKVKRMHLRYIYHLATSKYIITNSRLPRYFKKRKGQVYIQTWHGTPLKKLAHDVERYKEEAPKYLEEFQHDVNKWDYLISPNGYSTKCFKTAFKYEGEILEIGYPRNDFLKTYENRDIKRVKNTLGINNNNILLYTPTYRDDEKKMEINDILLDLKKLVSLKDWTILFRGHYLMKNKIKFDEYENIIDVTDYDSINDLFIISDLMITDYSSTMFDYSNLQRPMIFYTPDYEHYKNHTRGFYSDYETLIPGTRIKSTDELIIILNNYENYKMLTNLKVKEFNKEFNKNDDGQVTKRLIDIIWKED